MILTGRPGTKEGRKKRRQSQHAPASAMPLVPAGRSPGRARLPSPVITILMYCARWPEQARVNIDSVLHQTYKNWRLIITYEHDRCLGYLRSYQGRDKVQIVKIRDAFDVSSLSGSGPNSWITIMTESQSLTGPNALGILAKEATSAAGLVAWSAGEGEVPGFCARMDILSTRYLRSSVRDIKTCLTRILARSGVKARVLSTRPIGPIRKSPLAPPLVKRRAPPNLLTCSKVRVLVNSHSNLELTAGDTVMISNLINNLTDRGNMIVLVSGYPISSFRRNLTMPQSVQIVDEVGGVANQIEKINELGQGCDLVFIRNHFILDGARRSPLLDKMVFYGLGVHAAGLGAMNNRFHQVITQSERLKRTLVSAGVTEKRVVILKPLTYKYDFKLPERNDNEVRLIYCGTLRDEENILEIIEGFQEIHKERPEVVLKVVYGKIHGDAAFTRNINEHIGNGVEGITFKHNLSHREACYEIATSDIGLCWRKNGWGESGEVSTKVKEYKMYGLEIETNFSANKRLCVYTDLGLSTIDGSTMFIANLLNMLTRFSTYIITLYHMHKISDLKVKHIHSSVVRYHIKPQKGSKLILSHNVDYIFIRCWKGSDTWLIDSSLKDKCFSYLSLDSSGLDKQKPIPTKHYIYQTEKQLQFYKDSFDLKLDNSSYGIRLSPGGYLKDAVKKKGIESSIMYVNYIGTLREECCSNEMLSIMYEHLSKNKNVFFNLIIGKIHKNIKRDSIEKLSRLENCFVGYNFNEEDIKNIYKKSHVTISLWKAVNKINEYLLSSKMILGYLYNNVVLYLKPNYISDNIADASIGLNDVYELSRNLTNIYNTLQQDTYIKYSREVVTKYSYDMNIASLKKLLKCPCNFSFVHIFNNTFDYIYGLYIDKNEFELLQKIKKSYNMAINPFEGVDGNNLLKLEYEEYKNQPLKTEWEINKGIKRLSIGAMGHLHSFIKIVKDARKNNYKRILILEADIFPHKNLFDEFIKVVDVMEKYKILYLGAGMWNKDVVFKTGYYIPNQTTGTFAISFDKSIYDELIGLWEEMINPTDVCLWELTTKYKNECYVLSPNLIIADLSSSNIQNVSDRTELYKKFNWDINNYNTPSDL